MSHDPNKCKDAESCQCSGCYTMECMSLTNGVYNHCFNPDKGCHKRCRW